MHLFLDRAAFRTLSHLEVVGSLKIQPKLRGRAKISSEAERRISANSPPGAHNLIQARRVVGI